MGTSFSSRLKEARDAARKTQQQVAVHFGVAVSTVSRWEDGAEPEFERLAEIAAYLNVPAGWLAFGEGDPPFEKALALTIATVGG